jgi:molybdopterin-guanine dinucleotide biosynthesis protein A
MHRWLESVGAIGVAFGDAAAFRNINEPAGSAPAHSTPSE